MPDNGVVMSTIRLRDQPTHLQDRYGFRKTPRAVLVVACLAIAGILAFGGWTALRLGNPAVQSKLLTWNARAPEHTDITFEIRRPAELDAECVLRVQDQTHHDVGYATVSVPAGTSYVQETYSVATRAPGYAAELLGCYAAGNVTARPPDFPPGTSNPPQPWRP